MTRGFVSHYVLPARHLACTGPLNAQWFIFIIDISSYLAVLNTVDVWILSIVMQIDSSPVCL